MLSTNFFRHDIFIYDVSMVSQKKRGIRVYRLVCNWIFKIETNFKNLCTISNFRLVDLKMTILRAPKDSNWSE